jgi:hypothetical protein
VATKQIGRIEMEAINYKFPPSSETVYYAEIKIKKQAGSYGLTVSKYGDFDKSIDEKVQAALADVINKLNSK